MDRESILMILSENRRLLRDYGVKSIYLFGSVARGEAASASDVDLLVEFEPGCERRVRPFAMVRLPRVDVPVEFYESANRDTVVVPCGE